MRMKCSKLRAHLFLLHVIDSPACSCGFDNEDNKHYLLNCPLYIIERQRLMQNISTMLNTPNIDNENILLYGSENHNVNINKSIFRAVHQYIKDTKRL